MKIVRQYDSVTVASICLSHPAPCDADAFFCHSNMCINNTLVCNGIQNCVYPWDENQCKGEMLPVTASKRDTLRSIWVFQHHGEQRGNSGFEPTASSSCVFSYLYCNFPHFLCSLIPNTLWIWNPPDLYIDPQCLATGCSIIYLHLKLRLSYSSFFVCYLMLFQSWAEMCEDA